METMVFYLLMQQKIYQLKAKNSEIKPYPLSLGNVSKDFTAYTWKKDQVDISRIFPLVIILLILVIL